MSHYLIKLGTLLSVVIYSLTGGGDDGIRTHDPLLAGQVLSQLSYTPVFPKVLTPSLKDPSKLNNNAAFFDLASPLWVFSLLNIFCTSRCSAIAFALPVLHRKEVIQPHLPIRLPCYDLTPIIEPTFDCCLLAVSTQASGVPNFHGLTGGVYKARERIHRGMLIRDY